MKTSLVVWSTACAVALGTLEVSGQAPKPVPVYPGSQLVIEQKEGEEPVCCDFITQDSYQKVLAFYEKQLKTKPLDTKALAAKYPQMQGQIQMLEQEMGPGMQLRAFVLGEMEMPGGKAPLVFEVVSTPSGVTFNLDEQTFTAQDQHFAAEWRQKTGYMTEEEKLAQQQPQMSPEDIKTQKEEEEREAKKQAEYKRQMVAEFEKLYGVIKTKPYPGSQCEGVSWGEGEMSYYFSFGYSTKDDFKKVYDHYASKLKARDLSVGEEQQMFIRNGNGEKSYWGTLGDGHIWRDAMFDAAEAVSVEILELSQTPNGPRKAYVLIEVMSGNPAAEQLNKIHQKFQSE